VERLVPWLDRAVLTLALVILVSGTAGSGWLDATEHAVGAVQLERAAVAPLYGIVASAATLLPAGEPGFRLGVVNAVLGAIVLVGVLRAARALLPKDPFAGVVSVVLLAIAQPFHLVAAFAGPRMLATCGVVWAIVFALSHARTPSTRSAIAALACTAIVIGSAPWLGAALLIALLGWLGRTLPRPQLAVVLGAIGALAVLWWIDALGAIPAARPDPAAVLAASAPAALLVGAGLVGAAFGIATGLPHARWLGLATAITIAHAVVFDPDPTPLLALLAVAVAVIPSAVVRVIPERRHLVALAAGIPLIGVAAITSPDLAVDDPQDAPARLATDLLDDLPPGPGLFVATRPTTWTAVHYAQTIAGSRPDLSLASPAITDTNIVVAMRGKRVVGADVAALGRLDPKLAIPRGRGFQLLLAEPTELAPVPPPASYASERGRQEAIVLAVDRGRYEGVSGRLDLAARATGLAATRFGGAELAILATVKPTAERPALFQLVPALEPKPPGPWLLQLFGDDLAWVAGIEQPVVAHPPERRLHGLWRELLAGRIQKTDPAFALLGATATTATERLLAALGR
jgi:hypothetical protein